MSALAFQLQGLISGCCYVRWCFTCDQNWITLTGLWPLCTRVALWHFLCILFLKSSFLSFPQKDCTSCTKTKGFRSYLASWHILGPWWEASSALMRHTVNSTAHPTLWQQAQSLCLGIHSPALRPSSLLYNPRYLYVLTFVSLEWSWANLDPFISSIKFHCAGISTAVSYST